MSRSCNSYVVEILLRYIYYAIMSYNYTVSERKAFAYGNDQYK